MDQSAFLAQLAELSFLSHSHPDEPALREVWAMSVADIPLEEIDAEARKDPVPKEPRAEELPQTILYEEDNEQAKKMRSDLLTLKPGLWGVSIDLKELWLRVRHWWNNRR